MVEPEGPRLPQNDINPIISPESLSQVLVQVDQSNTKSRIAQVHPDYDPVQFTFSSIRHNLTPPFDADFYKAGMEAYLLARDIELKNPQEQFPLTEPATRYIKLLLGTDKSRPFTAQTRSLTEKIIEAYERDPATIPTINVSGLHTIASEIKSRTNTFTNAFPRLQPYVASFLERGFYGDGKVGEEKKAKLSSMATGMIDGDRIFKTAQEALFNQQFGRVSNRFKSFMRQ